MEHKVVIFGKGTVKIRHGIDPTMYQGRADCLVDPEFPRGIPPHQWRLKDGKISTDVTLPFPVQLTLPVPTNKTYKHLTIVLSIVSIVLLSALLWFSLHR